MGLLSAHEAIVWWEFQHGLSTSEIASEYENPSKSRPDYVMDLLRMELLAKYGEEGLEKELEKLDEKLDRDKFTDTAYVSRVLNRARSKIEKDLRDHARAHRLDIESVQDYKGLLRGFDYQANTEVYIVFTMKLGVVVWYKHDSYAGKLCPECPKEEECRETLDTIMREYDLDLRPDQEALYMTEQSIAIFNKLAAKEVARYKRQE
jgi:hypothetical protein